MASHLPLFSLLLLTTTISAVSTAFNTTPSLLPPPPTAALSPLSLLLPQQPPHFTTILDALSSAGNFRNWANLLDPSLLPFSATLFVPDDAAFLAAFDAAVAVADAPIFIDPLIFPYHVVPLRIPSAALRLFPAGSRLTTLLPGSSLLLTGNLTVDGAVISRPDLFLDSLVAVHGVGALLDYTRFGRDPPPETDVDDDGDGGEEWMSPVEYGLPSGAVSYCIAGFWVVLIALFWVERNVD